MRPPRWLIVVLVGALIGIVFAGVSTYDFVQHLDRQVHSLHCSFIPGVTHTGESGCQLAMMSPYSSVFRTKVWGGVPIALPAMAVFAFIMFYGLDLLVTKRTADKRATLFLVAATALPALTSLVMLTISLTKLGTTCKLCVCIYIASALCLGGAIMLWRRAQPGDAAVTSNRFLGLMLGAGVAFVVVPLVIYLAMAPDHSKFLGTCDNLSKSEDTYGVMVRVQHDTPAKAVPALEILDPLCPACKAFEQRLDSSGLADRLDRKAILFPLDMDCNWMISETTHPGACVVSEAVLCAGDRAPEVIEWAFEVQDDVRAQAKTDPTAAARIVKARFPELASCVGSAEARSKLNKSMRWAVNHNIRVLTPQLFVDNVKLCDEDVDLGLDYALSRMLDAHDKGVRLGPVPAEAPPQPAPGEMGSHHGSASAGSAARPPPAKPADIKPADAKPADPKPADPKPADAAGSSASPAAGSSSDAAPVTKPSEAPADKPADKPAGDPMPSEGSGSGGAP